MTFDQWCQKHVKPVVQDYIDGKITLSELTLLIFGRVAKGAVKGTLPKPE